MLAFVTFVISILQPPSLNAAILAAQIIGLYDKDVATIVDEHKVGLSEKIEMANLELSKLEYEYMVKSL